MAGNGDRDGEGSPADPLRYSVTFATNGWVGIQADCNRGSAPFEMDEGKVAIKSIALTRAICPEPAQADRFVRDLGRVTGFYVANGSLYLEKHRPTAARCASRSRADAA